MPITCDAADAPRLVRYIFEEQWSASDLIERRSELIRSGQLTSSTCVLFDLRKVTKIPPLDDLKRAIQTESAEAIWPACRAFLVMTQQQHDGARQLQAILGPH